MHSELHPPSLPVLHLIPAHSLESVGMPECAMPEYADKMFRPASAPVAMARPRGPFPKVDWKAIGAAAFVYAVAFAAWLLLAN